MELRSGAATPTPLAAATLIICLQGLAAIRLLWSILIGLLAMPLGSVAGVVLVYGALIVRGMPEDQGRRGLLAGLLGLVPGAIAGFMAGYAAARWIQDGLQAATRGLIAGIVTGVLLAVISGFVALLAGIHMAEARGVTNYAGERAAWGFIYVALPTALVTGIGGYLLCRWLAG